MLAYNSATYPMFNWCKNGATGPNAGTYDATNAAGTGIGGFNDWYIPAKNELEVLYYYLKPDTTNNVTTSGSNANAVSPEPASTNYTTAAPARTSVTLFQTGGAQAFSAAGSYWSATESSSPSNLAWGQGFGNGFQGGGSKSALAPYARAIRRVQA
jgi:hypothetical protein